MTVSIDKKIVNVSVSKEEDHKDSSVVATTTLKIDRMHEKIKRPTKLFGTTYKVKTPLSEHSLYITINDIVLNEGTPHEQRHPFEIFINSKNMDNFQWVVALTRIISSVFRKGGDVTFLVEDLRSVFDPKGGYFKRGGKYMPSLVAELGDVIESHLRAIGLIHGDGLGEQQRAFIAKKRAEYGSANKIAEQYAPFPSTAKLCQKCQTKSLIVMEGCLTCLNCGESKCS